MDSLEHLSEVVWYSFLEFFGVPYLKEVLIFVKIRLQMFRHFNLYII